MNWNVFRRTGLSSIVLNVRQFSIFLACIFISTNAAALPNDRNPDGRPPADPFSPGWTLIVLTGLVIAYSWYEYREECTEYDKKESPTDFLIFLFFNNVVTLLTIGILGSMAHQLAGLFFGHEVWALIVPVVIVKLMEVLVHRLLTLPRKIEKIVRGTVPSSLSAKNFFVVGTQHKKDVDEMLQFIHKQEKLEATSNGIAIFRFRSSPTEYAQVCSHFLIGAKQIESMSDMDMDKALPLFSNMNGPVMDWVKKVNQRKANCPTTEIHRVLVLTAERIIFLGALERLTCFPKDSESRAIVQNYSRLPVRKSPRAAADFDHFIVRATEGLKNFKEHYCQASNVVFNILAKTSKEIGGEYKYDDGVNSDFLDGLPRGEFIMFDRKYLVRFDDEARLLEVFIGEILGEFSRVFCPTAKNHLLSLGDDKRFSSIVLPLKPLVDDPNGIAPVARTA